MTRERRRGARTTSTSASTSGRARDELTGLAATLDNLLARIAASRRHEQRFAGEMAHELRTPIARMRGRAELALRAGPGGDAERAGALASVVAEVDRLTRAIDALLAVARRETDPTPESVDLAAIAREAADGATSSSARRAAARRGRRRGRAPGAGAAAGERAPPRPQPGRARAQRVGRPGAGGGPRRRPGRAGRAR